MCTNELDFNLFVLISLVASAIKVSRLGKEGANENEL